MSAAVTHPKKSKTDGPKKPSAIATLDQSKLFFDFEEKTDKEQVLDNPDTFIGSVESLETTLWVLDDAPASTPAEPIGHTHMEVVDGEAVAEPVDAEESRLPDHGSDTASVTASATTAGTTTAFRVVQRTFQYTPGLYKLYDEAIVNCRDHVVRMHKKITEDHVPDSLPVTSIDIDISPENGECVLKNDGNGIDVVQREDGMWIPELVFTRLRTSSNYSKTEEKLTGGKNGYGVKLVLIWSTFVRIETVDHIRRLKYVQEFCNNMDVIKPPKITKLTAEKIRPYTKFTFCPDLARMGLPPTLSEDMRALLRRRVCDIAAIAGPSVRVKLDGKTVAVRQFEKYIHCFLGLPAQVPRVYESSGPRWEYAVAMSPNNEFMHVSFVNGVHTTTGGKHVDCVISQITQKLAEFILARKKVAVKPSSIKEQLILFLRCDIVNPAFGGQTKVSLETPAAKFGSRPEVSAKFIEAVAKKLDVVRMAVRLTEMREEKEVKKQDGAKTRTVRVPKLNDANWAGTAKSSQCTLLLTEGDSATSGAISGLSAADRNFIGVFPLRGKLMNVHGMTATEAAKNEEIDNIKQILGLASGRVYTSLEDVHKHLRYGCVRFLTDQDLDGSHIKGLCINLFATLWPSLMAIPGFLGFMNTPILKASRHGGKDTRVFYNEGEYQRWKQSMTESERAKWAIKYYKGLGTSTKTEFREYFRNNKYVAFESTGPASREELDKMFNKKRADERKDWLRQYDPHAYLDTSRDHVTYEDFIHREMIHYNKYSCDRAIPSVVDGLKPSQRKVLFACFKRHLTKEIKVAQLVGYVSEHAAYHHGETSLAGTIIGMAQNYIGSNNLNWLVPSGQFGTRRMNGADAASPRYIFTRLNPITMRIFPVEDAPVLEYLDDDGVQVEPKHYVPILPAVLINGAEGIGSGFSTTIPCFSPIQILDCLVAWLESGEPEFPMPSPDEDLFRPFYRGSVASIHGDWTDGKYITEGQYHVVETAPDTICVTELPVGLSTDAFVTHVEKLLTVQETKSGKKTMPVLKEVRSNNTDSTVSTTLTFLPGKLAELEAAPAADFPGCNGVHKLLGLTSSLSMNNMNMFDVNSCLKHNHFRRAADVLAEYIPVRLEYYEKRRQYWIQSYSADIVLLENKVRFLHEVIDGLLVLGRKSAPQIADVLRARGYAEHASSARRGDREAEDDREGEDDGTATSAAGYRYLMDMKLSSLTKERLAKLEAELETVRAKRRDLEQSTPHSMWLRELTALRPDLEAEMVLPDDDPEDDTHAFAPAKSKSKSTAATGRKRLAPSSGTSGGQKTAGNGGAKRSRAA